MSLWLLIGHGYPNGVPWQLVAVYSTREAAVAAARREVQAQPVVCNVYRETLNDPGARHWSFMINSANRWGFILPADKSLYKIKDEFSASGGQAVGV
jgi:hypothetical protein